MSVLALTLTVAAVVQRWMPVRSDFISLGGLFLSGSAMFVWREQLRLRGAWVAAGAALMLAGALHSPEVFEAAYRLARPGALLWRAYRPGGVVRRYNRVGDYSYGVYIYAFPVQQALMASFPALGVAGLTMAALPLTVLCAMLSWHLVEHPALALKERLSSLRPASLPAMDRPSASGRD